MVVTLPATYHTMKRERMPQIRDISSLTELLDSVGIEYTELVVPTEKLKPTQLEVDSNKAVASAANSDSPIICDHQFYIIDGHHRWWGSMCDHSSEINCIKIESDFDVLLEILLKEFPPES